MLIIDKEPLKPCVSTIIDDNSVVKSPIQLMTFILVPNNTVSFVHLVVPYIYSSFSFTTENSIQIGTRSI